VPPYLYACKNGQGQHVLYQPSGVFGVATVIRLAGGWTAQSYCQPYVLSGNIGDAGNQKDNSRNVMVIDGVSRQRVDRAALSSGTVIREAAAFHLRRRVGRVSHVL